MPGWNVQSKLDSYSSLLGPITIFFIIHCPGKVTHSDGDQL